jgi:alpha-amylase
MTELVPPAFWAWAIPSVREQYPKTLFLAEIYQPHRYGEYLHAGFDYLYDKVGVYDFLIALGKGARDAADFTGVRDAVGSEQPAMCYFTENHDEQRLASDFVFASPRQGFLATAVAALSGGNPLLLYFGQELGEQGMDSEGFSGRDGRTTIFDYWSLDKLQRLQAGNYTPTQLTDEEASLLSDYQRLASCYTDPIISRGSYYGLRAEGAGRERVLAFARASKEGLYLVLANFSSEQAGTTLPLPAEFFAATGIAEGTAFRVADQLTDAVDFLCLTTLAPLRLSLAPHGLQILRLTAV